MNMRMISEHKMMLDAIKDLTADVARLAAQVDELNKPAKKAVKKKSTQTTCQKQKTSTVNSLKTK